VKSTPGEPGLRSAGDVPDGAPIIVASPIYCGLVIPKIEFYNAYRLILRIEYIPSVSGQMTVVVNAVVIAVVVPVEVATEGKTKKIINLLLTSISTHQ
jgi:hypothetical protein